MALFSRKGRLTKKWSYDAKSDLLAGPMVYDLDDDGRKEIVFGTKDGRIVLMNAECDVEWVYDVNEDVGTVESYFEDPDAPNSINAPPSIGDLDDDAMNEIVFGTEMGYVYALNNRGEVRWKVETDGAIRGGVLLDDVDGDGLLEVVFGSMDGTLYLVGARGDKQWSYDAGAGIEGKPARIPGTKHVVFGCHDGTVRCVELGGDELWRYQTEGKVVAQPVIDELYTGHQDVIVVGSTDYAVYALTLAGELVWKYKTEGAILSAATIADIDDDGEQEVVVGSCDNNVYALSYDGDKVWSYETYFWVVAPPLVEDIDDDGRLEVVVGSYDHNVYILDSEGVYALDYVPGLGGVVHQSGHYTDMMTKEPGKVRAEKIWQYETPGYVVGCAFDGSDKDIIVNVKNGRVEDLIHAR